ncbi:hypothetical protein M4578_22930 [Salipiger sp. P9]|uniref:hypothetical protein n=1 Tax=Salipiger pentaromativorans TaxID=2943193 RepID=UPI002157F9DE|nr:hypothetical protein [Salipiger pentaromativorans]MCR8550689.1 hypothetical protein [Salipiger pentaromativorans]
MTKQIASKVLALLSAAPAAVAPKADAKIVLAECPWTDPRSRQFRDIASCL